MKYIRTDLATDWPEKERWKDRLIRMALFFIPEANPSYRKRMHEIKEWLIEFDEEGNPWREIGVGSNGEAIVAGPSETDYGFWCDTHMTYNDFPKENIEKNEFEELWRNSGVAELKIVPNQSE